MTPEIRVIEDRESARVNVHGVDVPVARVLLTDSNHVLIFTPVDNEPHLTILRSFTERRMPEVTGGAHQLVLDDGVVLSFYPFAAGGCGCGNSPVGVLRTATASVPGHLQRIRESMTP